MTIKLYRVNSLSGRKVELRQLKFDPFYLHGKVVLKKLSSLGYHVDGCRAIKMNKYYTAIKRKYETVYVIERESEISNSRRDK